QCLQVVRDAIGRYGDGPGDDVPDGWLVGQGTGMSMIATGPPGGHFADATVKLLADGTYDVAVGTAEFG
ncbi:hypoxanthine oxidase, partial [Streptomyces sp. SID7982]|nr:hypoxanthine oxidase [Streptomyces sp. SID7982]